MASYCSVMCNIRVSCRLPRTQAFLGIFGGWRKGSWGGLPLRANRRKSQEEPGYEAELYPFMLLRFMLTGDKKKELTPALFNGFSKRREPLRDLGGGVGHSIVKGVVMLLRNFELYRNYYLVVAQTFFFCFFFSLLRDANELRVDYSEVDGWEDIFGKDFIPDRSKPPKKKKQLDGDYISLRGTPKNTLIAKNIADTLRDTKIHNLHR